MLLLSPHSMKAKLHFLFFLGLLLLKPLYSGAAEHAQHPQFNHSLQKTGEQHLPAVDALQDLPVFLSADVDVDEDDDASFSSRKKLCFERALCFYAILGNFLNGPDSPVQKEYRSHFHLSPSHFISLRVLRI